MILKGILHCINTDQLLSWCFLSNREEINLHYTTPQGVEGTIAVGEVYQSCWDMVAMKVTDLVAENIDKGTRVMDLEKVIMDLDETKFGILKSKQE